VSNHSFTVSFQSSWDLPLVVFSNFEKAFSLQELEKKLPKTLRHIEHFADQICHKYTHDGKIFRTKQISIKDQINFEENNHSVEHKGKKYNYRIIS